MKVAMKSRRRLLVHAGVLRDHRDHLLGLGPARVPAGVHLVR